MRCGSRIRRGTRCRADIVRGFMEHASGRRVRQSGDDHVEHPAEFTQNILTHKICGALWLLGHNTERVYKAGKDV